MFDERINIGDKLDIEVIDTRLSADPDKKPSMYTSQVLDEGEYNSLFVAMPIKEGKLVPLSVDQELNVTFFTKSALLQCKAIVTGRFKKGTIFLMQIELLSALKKVQRREYFRFPCRIPIEYRIIEGVEKTVVEPGDAYNIDEWQMDWKKGVMLDLSGGGVRFVTTTLEKTEALVQVRFDIVIDDKPDVIYSFAHLLRSERNPNNKSLFDTRIEFWRMDQGTREKIIRYIFEEQRRNRSKQLGS